MPDYDPRPVNEPIPVPSAGRTDPHPHAALIAAIDWIRHCKERSEPDCTCYEAHAGHEPGCPLKGMTQSQIYQMASESEAHAETLAVLEGFLQGAAPVPRRENLAEGREHFTVTGTFQSDKYLWCPAGYLPLKISDPLATDLLYIYASRREHIDGEFARDLRQSLPGAAP